MWKHQESVYNQINKIIIIIIIIIIIERLPGKKIWKLSFWKKKKSKTSKFVDAGSDNRNERERGKLTRNDREE